MTDTRHLLRVAATILTAALLASCSRSPLAPEAPVHSGATATAIAPTLWNDGSSDTTSVPAPLPSTPSASSSRLIDPLIGGVVSAGQFKVVVPPGALRQRATITVHQPDLGRPEVQLEISPPSANGFLVPVMLIADCKSMPLNILKIQTIWWWNPEAQRWDAVVSAQVNLLGRSVSAPLWHFSTYKVGGKAGW